MWLGSTPGGVAARPIDPGQLSKPTPYDWGAGGGGVPLSGLSGAVVFGDTVCYGGTAPDGQPDPIPGALPALRPFKAIRNGAWSFNSGVGSNFTDPARTPKPAGFHRRMEGWSGYDNTYQPQPWFRRSALCVLNGGYSLYAGVSLAESQSLCYAAGAGYGNNWNITMAKSFNYPGPGGVTLSYRYQTDAEPTFDYLYVNIDTTGTGAQPDVNLTSYTGVNPATTVTFMLTRGVNLRSTPGPVTLKFNVTADGGYSDEDGAYATTCGHSTIDDIQLTGAILDVSDFEAGPDGWSLLDPGVGPGGDWSDLRALNSLPPPLTFCPCAMADSVLVFADLTGGHGGAVDDLAISPWIDLRAGGDVGRPGKLIQFHGYFELPLTNYIFVQALAAWYPALCPDTGLPYVKPLTSDGFVRFFGGVPNCTAPGAPVLVDFSSVIPSTAEQVRIAVGVLGYCGMFANCTGVTNSTPWFDQLSLCVFGTAGAPFITLRTTDVLQDSFAADGTDNFASTARVDINTVKGATHPAPGTVLGDTLVVLGDGGNQEVRVVFRVRPGPFINLSNLAAWAAARWTNEPGLGAGWYSARLDTAEQGGTITAGRWMGTLHEQDPKFGGGTDTQRGGEGDVNGLTHDIFPDHILTPGSRIDYFVKARFLPPDPRNPGGTAWSVAPDTTGGVRLEMEVMPGSLAPDSTWNCTLYVDHHADRDAAERKLEEAGLAAALGPGGHNAEGTRYDRYDVNAPGSGQASWGRPLNSVFGASLMQAFVYKAIVWHSGTLAAYNLVDEDANYLSAWLGLYEVGYNRFWVTGDGAARSMASEGEPATISFLNYYLGVRFTCDTIRLATCPSGSALDSTYCLPLTPVAGAEFGSAPPVSARGNGCPNIRSFDLIANNTSIATARGQLAYQKLDGVRNFAAVTNHTTIDVEMKTVVDGIAVGALRDPHGDPHNPARCDLTTPAIARAVTVFTWFQGPREFSLCEPCRCCLCIDVPEGGPPAAPSRTALGAIYPNPMNPGTRIAFTNGRAGGRVTLTVFDVTGRRVRQLLDEPRPVGAGEATWDGRDDDGRAVGSGLYFVRLSTRDVVQSRKLVVAK